MNIKAALGKFLVLIISSILAVFIFEIGTYFLASKNVILINTPTYTLTFDERREFFSPWFVDIEKHFGVWHPPNTSSRHLKKCFDVIYESNSFGSRDSERQKISSTERVIVLGDSFIEGFGVERGKRLSDLLEERTGILHLNFGTSGDFGPTQYFLLYKFLAKDFTHSAILIGLLPANDFADDNYLFGKEVHQSRYRPYWIGKYPAYELVYFQEDLTSSRFTTAEFERSLKQIETEVKAEQDKWQEQGLTIYKIKFFLRRFSYSYNALVEFNNEFAKNSDDGIKSSFPYRTHNYSGYYDFTEFEFDRLKYALEKIVQESRGKPIYVFSIPVQADFLRYSENKDPPLSKKLHEFSNLIGIEYIDLLPLMYTQVSDYRDYFFSCDGHWNEFGNNVASEILIENLSIYNKAPVD